MKIYQILPLIYMLHNRHQISHTISKFTSTKYPKLYHHYKHFTTYSSYYLTNKLLESSKIIKDLYKK